MAPPDIAAIARERVNKDGSVNFPGYMVGDGKVLADLREIYARIVRAIHDDRQLMIESRLALEWCRANGNPHRAARGTPARLVNREDAVALTRPIIGIENRTAHEVFDIMCGRLVAILEGGA